MKLDLTFKNKKDEQLFNEIMSSGQCVQLEVSGRYLGNYKHCLFTPHRSYSGTPYTTDVFEKMDGLREGVNIGVYTGRYLTVEKVVGAVKVEKLKVSERYIRMEEFYSEKSDPKTKDRLLTQDVRYRDNGRYL